MNNRRMLFDYFFLTRPVLFIPGLATLLAGYAAAGDNIRFISSALLGEITVELWNPKILLSFFLFSCAMGGCFILNQLQDIQSDKKNHKLFLLGDGLISRRAAFIESLLLLLLSVAGALLINRTFLAAMVVFNLITGLLYNLPPFEFKNKPVPGLFANMAMGWLAFCLGWALVKPSSPVLVITSLPYLFFNTALYFLTTLPDMRGDREAGKQTFPIKYGLKFTMALCFFFFILAIGTALWHKNEFMLAVVLLTLPFMLRLAFKHTIAAAIVAVKSGIAAFALLICGLFPPFFALLALVFFCTRSYYKSRFRFDYPNFKGR